MNNFKSASLIAAASLSALSFGIAMPASAQTASASTPAALSPTSARLDKSTVAAFSAQYHVPVVQDTTPMVAVPLDGAPPTDRLRDLQRLAVDAGVTWRKVYRVSPATADHPVTTLAAAQRMVDQPAQVSLNVTGIPESSAFRTVAAADSATVKYTGGASASDISVDLAGRTVPQAIAALARETNTHWQAVYLLAPVIGNVETPSRFAYAGRPALTEQQQQATQYNNGPFTIHFANPATPPVTAASTAADSAQAAAQAQQQTANAAGANGDAAADPNSAAAGYTSPYNVSPYGQFGGYNPYMSYYQPSIAVGDGSVVSTPFYGYGSTYGSEGVDVIGGGAVIAY